MPTLAAIVKLGLLALGSNVIGEQIYNEYEKNKVTIQAYRYAKKRGKPVLDFGCGFRSRGEYNVDVKPRNAPNFIQIQSFESPRLPFPDKFFASALALHVLEHTYNPENALKELRRVAERVYMLTPKPIWILTYLHPDHKWIFLDRHVYFRNPLHLTYQELNENPLLYPE